MTDSLCLYNTGIKQLWMCLREAKPSVEEFLRKMPGICIECRFELNFSSALGYHKTESSLVNFKVAGISEGKEGFIHQLIRLICGTCDDPDDHHNR